MSRTVWKFLLDVRDAASWRVAAEISARVVAVRGMSAHHAEVWIELDPAAEMLTLQFLMIGTGQPIPEGHSHVGAGFCDPFVWHIYQRRWDAPK